MKTFERSTFCRILAPAVSGSDGFLARVPQPALGRVRLGQIDQPRAGPALALERDGEAVRRQVPVGAGGEHESRA